MIKIASGNLLDSAAQTLVNPVNCVGVMGAGLALEFKRRYPQMFATYRANCGRGWVKPGILWVHSVAGERKILLFPTKIHWRDPSRIEWIEAGLENLARQYEDLFITSLALPALGCGNGGLGWRAVWPLIVRTLGDIEIPIEVYPPPGI